MNSTGGVAQSVEHRADNPEVAGSIPASATNLYVGILLAAQERREQGSDRLQRQIDAIERRRRVTDPAAWPKIKD